MDKMIWFHWCNYCKCFFFLFIWMHLMIVLLFHKHWIHLLTGICAKRIRTFSALPSWVAPLFWCWKRTVEFRMESADVGLKAPSERLMRRNTCLPWERFCCQLPSGKHFSLLSFNCITYSTLVSSLFNVQIYWMHLVKRKAQTVMKFSHYSDRFTSEMQ